MFSFWEKDTWLSDIDVAIIGSGITGLSTAIHLKKSNSNLRIVVLEQGMLPSGASTKNAGFACFGSVGELDDDLQNNSLENVVQLVEKRRSGLDLLRNLLGDSNIDYKNWGGFELFQKKSEFELATSRIAFWNDTLRPLFSNKDVFEVSHQDFGFQNTSGMILNRFESQIDTGKMMQKYILLAKENGISIFNGASVLGIEDSGKSVQLNIAGNKLINARKVVVCSNGFAQKLVQEDVLPARAQVLITKPIPNLHFKGTFHFDKGYFYFRNIGNRILLGGGRNLNVVGETTIELETTLQIQTALDDLLKTVILPTTTYEIEHRWAGVMGVGSVKSPIVKMESENVVLGVRLGGMGVALGTAVGKECAQLLLES